MAATATSAPVRTPWWQQRRIRHALAAYLFILPSFLGVFIFIAFPVLFALYMSLQEWDAITDPQFVGLTNFVDLASDTIFWIAFRNTFVYTLVTMPIGVLLSLGVAQLLNQRVIGLSFFRTAMFIPVITSGLAIAVIWKWIYDYDNGLINNAMLALNLPQIPWLSDPIWAMTALCIIGIWQGFGFTTVIILAALQNVPDSLLEAASIDGANSWSRFWRVTIPLIAPTLLFVMIITFIGSFQVFTQIYYITGGGPDYGTSVLNYLVFQRAFQQNRFGSAAALSYVMFAIIFIVTILQLRLSRRAVNAAAEFEV